VSVSRVSGAGPCGPAPQLHSARNGGATGQAPPACAGPAALTSGSAAAAACSVAPGDRPPSLWPPPEAAASSFEPLSHLGPRAAPAAPWAQSPSPAAAAASSSSRIRSSGLAVSPPSRLSLAASVTWILAASLSSSPAPLPAGSCRLFQARHPLGRGLRTKAGHQEAKGKLGCFQCARSGPRAQARTATTDSRLCVRGDASQSQALERSRYVVVDSLKCLG